MCHRKEWIKNYFSLAKSKHKHNTQDVNSVANSPLLASLGSGKRVRTKANVDAWKTSIPTQRERLLLLGMSYTDLKAQLEDVIADRQKHSHGKGHYAKACIDETRRDLCERLGMLKGVDQVAELVKRKVSAAWLCTRLAAVSLTFITIHRPSINQSINHENGIHLKMRLRSSTKSTAATSRDAWPLRLLTSTRRTACRFRRAATS